MVNIEVDIIAKYVEKMISSRSGDDNKSDEMLKLKLREEGFIP
jgi:hypothetical protein